MPPIPLLSERAHRFGAILLRSPRTVLAALIAAMVVIGVLIALNIRAQSDARLRAESEGNMLVALTELRSTLLDAETGQRGYILTGDAAYLQPYGEARRRFERDLDRAELLLAAVATTREEQRLRTIAELSRSKLAELDHTVSLARAGDREVALAIVRSSRGKRDMDTIRQNIAALDAAQAERRGEAFGYAGRVERRILPLIFLLWLTVGLLAWAGIVGERRRATAQAEAEQADLLRAARDRATLLAEELNHRVKNLFSVVLSIVQLTGRKEATGKEVSGDIAARVMALSQAHSAALEPERAQSGLEALIRRTLAPYAGADQAGLEVSGPLVELDPAMLTPLALLVHELATNAAKYGALSVETGTLTVTWRARARADGSSELVLNWTERGGPAPVGEPATRGFGSQLASVAAAQLRGRIEREWPPEGAVVRLTMPLPG
ncbi:MAG: CHASE3 domain-containing protein [Novosphingobium sp.]